MLGGAWGRRPACLPGTSGRGGCSGDEAPGGESSRCTSLSPSPLQPDSERGLHAGASAVAVLRNSQLACPLRRPGQQRPPWSPAAAASPTAPAQSEAAGGPRPPSACSGVLRACLAVASLPRRALGSAAIAVQPSCCASRCVPAAAPSAPAVQSGVDACSSAGSSISPTTVSADSSWGPPACCGRADTTLHPGRTLVPRRMQGPRRRPRETALPTPSPQEEVDKLLVSSETTAWKSQTTVPTATTNQQRGSRNSLATALWELKIREEQRAVEELS